MSSAQSSSDIKPEPAPAEAPSPARLARIVLFLGAFEIVLFGLLTYAITRAARMSIVDLKKLTGPSLSLEQLETVHPHLRSFAIALALCGIVPGAVYVLCSVGLKRSMRLAAPLTILLAGTQLLVLGVALIHQSIGALMHGEPAQLSITILAIGTPMAFLVYVIRSLFQSRRT